MFARTADQQLFEETTKRFLEAECTPAKRRDLAGTKAGFDAAFWKQGAELGWTSLVVPEGAGGGSISGDGAMDLALVAFQFGFNAAPGPLTPANVVAAALSRWGTDDQRDGTLAALLSGAEAATWAVSTSDPNSALDHVTISARSADGGLVLDGVAAPVEAGAEASQVLVTARHDGGLTQVLVPSDAPGVTVTPLQNLDLTRRFARLEFTGVRAPASWLVGEPAAGGRAVEWQHDLAATIQLAEMCGAITWAFETTVDWTLNRYSFGRPLASYQEIKHRLADMKMWLEASYAITVDAARSLSGDERVRAKVVSAGKFYVGRYGLELVQDCIQLHGGIGVTFDHDLHFFLRRVATNAQLHGTPDQHAIRLATLLASEDRA